MPSLARNVFCPSLPSSFLLSGPEHDSGGPPADPARRDHEREPLLLQPLLLLLRSTRATFPL